MKLPTDALSCLCCSQALICPPRQTVRTCARGGVCGCAVVCVCVARAYAYACACACIHSYVSMGAHACAHVCRGFILSLLFFLTSLLRSFLFSPLILSSLLHFCSSILLFMILVALLHLHSCFCAMLCLCMHVMDCHVVLSCQLLSWCPSVGKSRGILRPSLTSWHINNLYF